MGVARARRMRARRWGIAAGGIGMLCSLPALAGALPVSAPRVDPAELRERILASDIPYAGFAESRGELGLPDLPGLGAVAGLLGERTQLRVWHRSERRWRVDVLTATGERDTYAAGDGTVTWDYERNQLSRLTGAPAVRLPRPDDLLPPELGRRLLAAAGGQHLARLPARRVAGVAAAGVRLTPDDPDTTVGHVDVWADPESGLPVEVRVTGRGAGSPGLTTRFLDLDVGRAATPSGTMLPPSPDRARAVTAEAPQLNAYIDRYAVGALPDRLAGHDRTALAGDGRAMRTYGQGFATFAVAALPGRLGERAYDIAVRGGADVVEEGGDADGSVVLSTPLLALVITPPGPGRDAYLLAGPVREELLTRAAGELA